MEERTVLLTRLLVATALVTGALATGTAAIAVSKSQAAARASPSAPVELPPTTDVSARDHLDASPRSTVPPATPSPQATFAPPPACEVGDVLTAFRGYDDHARTLLDWKYMLPMSYVPPDLIRIEGGHMVRSIIVDDLSALRDAAASGGVRLAILSAYRSFAQQRTTFANEVAKVGQARALRISARPGHSEHLLGTTVDFGSTTGPLPWEMRDWAQTREGAWLAAHAWEHGFVLSYPAGKVAVTCYDYEPWHFRWIGREAAALVRESGLTLREYQLRTNGGAR